MDYLNKFSERLVYLRKSEGLTLKELSEELGDIKIASLSRYEHKRREPKLKTLLKIANYFDCSLDYLLGRTDFKNTEKLIDSNSNHLEETGILKDICNKVES